MPSTKVLFLINTLRIGGFERDVATLCEHIDRDRFQPEVWVLHGGGAFEERVKMSGVPVRNLGRGWARNPLFAWKAAREISRSDAALIHAFLPVFATYAAMARSWFGIPQPMVFSFGQSDVGRGEGWKLRWCSRTFDWLVANSASAERLGLSVGFSPEKSCVIPNGHQIDRYSRLVDRQSIRASLGVEPHERMLLCVGRLIDTKRQCDAIAAVDLLRELAGIKLIIVGEGPERAGLEADVAARGLSGIVKFAGPRSDIDSLLQAADVFVFPSETEGLPNALIEACLAGLPVVACHVQGVIDVVNDGETALLVPPRSPGQFADAVRSLLLNRALADRLAASAQSDARNKYSIERSLSALYDVYDRLLMSRNGQSQHAMGLA
jgi:glycosyltransferase involved in cell wall biosynthesis